jgi:hypothetical protein
LFACSNLYPEEAEKSKAPAPSFDREYDFKHLGKMIDEFHHKYVERVIVMQVTQDNLGIVILNNPK